MFRVCCQKVPFNGNSTQKVIFQDSQNYSIWCKRLVFMLRISNISFSVGIDSTKPFQNITGTLLNLTTVNSLNILAYLVKFFSYLNNIDGKRLVKLE